MISKKQEEKIVAEITGRKNEYPDLWYPDSVKKNPFTYWNDREYYGSFDNSKSNDQYDKTHKGS